jgi:two-component system cell cycle sensor histidine kinase/response regulator CckA
MAIHDDEAATHGSADLRQIEASLREAEWKFRALFENGPIGVAYHRVVYDDDGRPCDYHFIDVNQRYIELTGVDPRGKLVTEAFPGIENDPFDWIGTFCRVGITGESVRVQQHLELNDRWYDLVGYQYKPDHFVGAFLDITERMRAQEELRRSEARYRTLFEKTRDAIVVVEKTTGIIRDANDAALELTGRPARDLIGRHVREVSDARSDTRMREVEVADEPIEFGRTVFYRPDGTERIGTLTTVPFDDEHVFGIAHDITSELELEERFRQAQKMEAVGHLAGGVAHDFNNILVPIIGYADLALSKLGPDSEIHAELSHIKKSAERAADLTRQILAFGRRQLLEMTPLDLGRVVGSLRPMIERLIPETIRLTVAALDGPAMVVADRAQLEQIVMNLVINAADAMPEGGSLSLTTGSAVLDATAAARLAPDTRPGPYVTLAVRDDGQGMDPGTREHIFEPFFTTKAVDKGTGLGLSTVFGIVKQHEGFIDVETAPDAGTTITVYLPQNDGTAEKPAEGAAARTEPQGDETILVVEDEAVVRRLVCETLRRFGYQVLEADGPTHGLQVAAGYDGAIELLLSDVIMPEFNGRELFDQLVGDRPELRVLYMSGYSDTVIARHGVLGNGVNFLQKPFSIEDLARRVREVLDAS